MFPEHLHSAYLCSPRVWSHHFNWRLYSHVRLRCSTSGSSSETQRIVVISQVSGAVSAQRLNKALKINHSSFLGANSHSELLQSSQTPKGSVWCDSKWDRNCATKCTKGTTIHVVLMTWHLNRDVKVLSCQKWNMGQSSKCLSEMFLFQVTECSLRCEVC